MAYNLKLSSALLFFITCTCMNAFSQGTLNVTRVWTPQRPYTSETDVNSSSRTVSEVTQATQYVDGFGRTVQNIVKKGSPLQKDLVEMHIYNNSAGGREEQKMLPFVSNIATTGDVPDDGNYKTDAALQQSSFYQAILPGESNFYNQVNYENSPSEKVLNIYAAGSSWAGSSRGTGILNLVNTVLDNVQVWNIAAAQGSIPSSAGYYGAGQLSKTITTDERGMQTIEFKDMDGLVILKKIQVSAAADNGLGCPHSGWNCTYYVYDDYNNMRFILTPKVVAAIDGTWSVSSTLADELCTRFEYDLLNRVIIKKNPGAGEQWIVYDQRGRTVMTQDANQRFVHQWIYYQFDAMDRPVSKGIITDATNYNNLSYHQGLAASSITYPVLSTPGYAPEVLLQTFYDNYNWVSGSGSGLGSTIDQTNLSNTSYFITPSNTSSPYAQPVVQSTLVRGLVTGIKTEVLGSLGSQYLYSVSFYDDKGRMDQYQENNIVGGIDKITTQYAWNGKTLRILEQHAKNTATTQTHLLLTTLNYDAAWRLKETYKSIATTINASPVVNVATSGNKLIASYTYNELGQMSAKNLGTNPATSGFLETLAYSYNIRGWLTGINKNYTLPGATGNFFGLELGYDKTATTNGTTSFNTPAYTGNISGQVWRMSGDGASRKYDFTYDNVNQLSAAGYLQNINAGSSSWVNTYMDYSVNAISYDLNGNIKTLNQNAFILGGTNATMDNLTYNYTNTDLSNKLLNVVDNANNPQSKLGDFHYSVSKTSTSTDYGYDSDGNQISDINKNITSITYNALNLPYVITFAGNKTITYTYDAAGHKLKKQTTETGAAVQVNNTSYTSDITTTATYIRGFVYYSKIYTNYSNSVVAGLNQPEALQYIIHEEGRAKMTALTSTQPVYTFDYFLKDNLGNIRVTLTDEVQVDFYPAATVEPTTTTINGNSIATIAFEQKYYNIINDASHIIPVTNLSWYAAAGGSGYSNGSFGLPVPPDPTVNPTAATTQLYKLKGGTGGDRFGLGIALKVMAGDNVHIYGQSVWHNNGASTDNTSYTLSGVLSSFLNAFAGTSAVTAGSHGVATGTVLNGNSPTTGNLNTVLNNVPTPPNGMNQPPKAYINWILFDEQFQPVTSGSSYDAINSSPDQFKPHNITVSNIPKSGYLYVYCSNESNQDVYFDNFQVVATHSPLTEEKSYYPQGLPMFALTSNAYGKLPNSYGYQGKEMQNNEFNDGSGLEEYDFSARYYDAQLARWNAQDPEQQFASPYLAMANSWPNGVDPEGTTWAGNLLRAPLNDLKIIGGLFAWNKHQTIGGNLLQILSRFTWQLPQETAGLVSGLVQNSLGGISRVGYFDGLTVMNSDWLSGQQAFTLGNFTASGADIALNVNNSQLQHEYGRYLQSQLDGPTYLTFTAIPDLFSPGNGGRTAIDGNARSFMYFSKTYRGLRDATFNPGGGFTWNFNEATKGNPLNGIYDPSQSINSPNNNAVLKNSLRSPTLGGYLLFSGIGPAGDLTVALVDIIKHLF